MKAHLAKVSLALLSTAFLLGCQERGAGPVGLEGLGLEFARKCASPPCGGGGDGGGGGTVPVDITVTGGVLTVPDDQVVGFKDLRKELELESAGSDPKINLAFNMTATHNNAMHEPTEEDPLAFDPAICVQSGRGSPNVTQLNALFNVLRGPVRTINFFFVQIDKTVLQETAENSSVFIGPSEKHKISANGPDADGTTRVFKVVSPPDPDRQIIVEKSGDITNGGLTFTFTRGNVLLRSFIEDQPHGFNLTCPNLDEIIMTLTSQ